jgi:pyruvate dehydrogenase E2 component (dihydrolipoamide acetyltransferase)
MNKNNRKYFDLQRRVVAYKTSASWRDVPHVSYLYEPDVTDLIQEFAELNRAARPGDARITLNTLMIKVVVEGLLAAPELNSWIEFNPRKADGFTQTLDAVNVTIPWLLADGRMITPTIQHAETRSLKEISLAIAELSRRIENTNVNELLYQAALQDTWNEVKKFNFKSIWRILASQLHRERLDLLTGQAKERYAQIPQRDRLTEQDLMSGTVTVSNIGSLYKEQRGFFALLEIVPPQVFAIGIGSVQERPGIFVRADGGKENAGGKEIGIRKILPMCLAFDHRAVDFNSLVPFMKRLDQIFADPAVIHTW